MISLSNPALCQFLTNVVGHQSVRHEQDTFLGQGGDDVVYIAGGDADIGFRFYFGGAVYVTHDCGIGVQGLHIAHIGTADRVCQAATRIPVRNDHQCVR